MSIPASQFSVSTSTSSDLVATEADLMCNYYPRDTGLPGIIVNAMQRGKMQHGPRLKVALREKLGDHDFDAVVTIAPNPEVVAGELQSHVARLVIRFIDQNHDVLKRLWDEEISCAEAAQLFHKLADG